VLSKSSLLSLRDSDVVTSGPPTECRATILVGHGIVRHFPFRVPTQPRIPGRVWPVRRDVAAVRRGVPYPRATHCVAPTRVPHSTGTVFSCIVVPCSRDGSSYESAHHPRNCWRWQHGGRGKCRGDSLSRPCSARGRLHRSGIFILCLCLRGMAVRINNREFSPRVLRGGPRSRVRFWRPTALYRTRSDRLPPGSARRIWQPERGVVAVRGLPLHIPRTCRNRHA